MSTGRPTPGRLYRAVGASGPQAAEALLALEETRQHPRVPHDADPLEEFAHLLMPGEAAGAAGGAPLASQDGGPVTGLDGGDATRASATSAPDDADMSPHGTGTGTGTGTGSRRPAIRSTSGRGLTWIGASVVLVVLTLGAALVTAVLTDSVGMIAGLVLAGAATGTALTVRHADRWAPAVMAPLAWALAIVLAGQLTVQVSGLLGQVLMLFDGLSANAVWVVSPVVIGAVIASVRGHRGL